MDRRHLVIALATAVVLLAATAAYAPYHTNPTPPPPAPGQSSPAGLSAVKAQAKVAATHAGFAAEAQSVSSAKEHLGHTLVCIEGSKGKNVQAGWGNPCQGMGNGVLVDLERANASASLLQQARSADETAVAALQSTDLAQIKANAKRVSTVMAELAK